MNQDMLEGGNDILVTKLKIGTLPGQLCKKIRRR